MLHRSKGKVLSVSACLAELLETAFSFGSEYALAQANSFYCVVLRVCSVEWGSSERLSEVGGASACGEKNTQGTLLCVAPHALRGLPEKMKDFL